ncbi:MAG: sporulation protein [Candidatus Thorarchaeota archaeon]
MYTERNEFLPGDDVQGHVVVSTDKSFSCNRIILKLRGSEYTHYQAGKVHVSETHQLLHEDLEIWEWGDIHSGNTRIEFSFRLPLEIPPTYHDTFGKIDYSIEAVVEIDRALDPKCKMELQIVQSPPPFIPEMVDLQPIRGEKDHLQVEIPTDILRPREDLVVRFLVKERSRIKGVRIDILMHDDVVCQGRKLESNTGLSEKRIRIAFNDFDRWIETSMLEDWSSYAPFDGTLIKSTILLKVVLEVGLSLDPYVEFPLRLSGEREEEDDIFDAIELDLGW